MCAGGTVFADARAGVSRNGTASYGAATLHIAALTRLKSSGEMR
jgi:hypothetical protein